jgi:hypothetical protein
MRIYIFLIANILLISGCATKLDGDRYRDLKPSFDLFNFFDGEVTAWGVVQNRKGELVQRFEVDIIGEIRDNTITLDESFRYGLGNGVEKRIWSIERLPDGRYRGGAGDISGDAYGDTYGNAFRWRYTMDLPLDDRTVKVRFDDWIWALDELRIINRSYIQKFGLDVAEVTIFMQKKAVSTR